MVKFTAKNNLVVDLPWVVGQLVEDELISQAEANRVRGTSRTKKQLTWHPLEWVAHMNVTNAITQDDITLDYLVHWLANHAKLAVEVIDPRKVNVVDVTSIMAFKFAESHHVLALRVAEGEVVIGTDQPFHSNWEHGLAQAHKDVLFKLVMVNPVDLRRYRMEFYNLAKSMEGAAAKKYSRNDVGNFEQLIKIGGAKNPDANDEYVVNIVDWLLQYAFDQRASDLHLEPRRETGHIRFRIDGVLHDVYEMPVDVLGAVVSRVKVLGRLDITEKRKPQDGRIKSVTERGEEVELRVSTLPTAYGEKVVMRVFDPDVLERTYSQLGFSQRDFDQWLDMTKHPNGIVLVTGPTGSGKTTTLYTTLKSLASREVNVCTLEDPIEMVDPLFNQVQVQPNIGMTFQEGLRALLRQDPDIIMVGEIRELMVAEMAVQAALTGHLVVSTLHTNDAPSAITRLLDLGIPDYMINATVVGVMAQRLVRTLCPNCKMPTKVDADQWQRLIYPFKSKMPETVYVPGGCVDCRNTGFSGRQGVYEIMELSQTLKKIVVEGAPLAQLRKAAVKEGMHTLRLSGAQKIAAGLTSIEEVLRVTPYNEL